MDRPGVRQVLEGSGEQGKMEKTGCKIICGAPTTLAVKGLMMIMVMVMLMMMMMMVMVVRFFGKKGASSFLTALMSINTRKDSEGYVEWP